ncbi:SPOR domain-containing protein [Sphingomonas parapaucimobilis]|uniref:SPOR domain-containing protein n=1 Tax=Sphingomonas parapaucimobilis TaxID=28213 RepID=UPI00321C1494
MSLSVSLVLAGAAIVQPSGREAPAGTRDWMVGRFPAAVAHWRAALAVAGPDSVEAAYGLGLAYHLGKGVAADRGRALTMLRRAAEARHPAATEQLALMLAERPETRGEALRLLDRAARMGRSLPQYLMGVAYANGEGVAVDRPLAMAFLTRAAAGGLTHAQAMRDTLRAAASPAERDQADRLAATLTGKGARRAPPSPRTETPTRAAKAIPTISGRWGMQLGAFGKPGGAEAAWAAMVRDFAGLRRHAPIYVRGADVTRLRVSGWSQRSEAEALCRDIRASGRPCLLLAGQEGGR